MGTAKMLLSLKANMHIPVCKYIYTVRIYKCDYMTTYQSLRRNGDCRDVYELKRKHAYTSMQVYIHSMHI